MQLQLLLDEAELQRGAEGSVGEVAAVVGGELLPGSDGVADGIEGVMRNKVKKAGRCGSMGQHRAAE